MKKYRLISLLLTAALLLSSCKEQNSSTVASVEKIDFGGVAFETSMHTAEKPLSIPEAVTSTPEAVTEAATSDASDLTTTSDLTVSSETTTSTVLSSSAPETTTAKETKTEKTTSTSKTTAVTTTTTTQTSATTTTQTSATTAYESTENTTKPPISSSLYVKNTYKAVNHKYVKGVWISYLEITELLNGKSESEFRKSAEKIYDNCTSLGINTVYVHARAFGDAFYYSDLFPFTKYISGTTDNRTSYDPYEILIDEAHERGLSFHAWINPLRLCGDNDFSAMSGSYPIKKWYNDNTKKGKYIVNVNGTWYLNPAYDDTVRLVGDGVREIVSRYDVDGIHIDDYFYPTTDSSFDSSAYNNSGASSLSAFRIDNCNRLVKEIYNAVHECSASAVFGASTQGSMSNNINQLYADAEAWCKGGYVDYFAPQIYYGFENSTQPFKKCTDEWNSMVSGTNTKLYIGLAVYKIGKEDKWAGAGAYEWTSASDILKRQIEYTNSCSNCSGIVLYSYNYLFTDGYVNSDINKEINNFKPLLTD